MLEFAREVATNNNCSTEHLVGTTADPYCGKRQTTAPSAREKELERQLELAKKQSGYDNRGLRGRASFRGRGGGPPRGNFNGNYGGPSHQNYGGPSHQNYGGPSHQNYGQNNYQHNQPAGPSANRDAEREMVREKLLQTCSLYNSGEDCPGTCGKKHKCSVIIR